MLYALHEKVKPTMSYKKKTKMSFLVTQETIASKIFLIRGKKVMLDRELSELYDVETKMLKRAVKRNIERFPDDFMIQLAKAEYDPLRHQFGTLKRGQHSKYLPFAFTQEGVAMLSSILNSKRAIMVNIQIMRTFTKLREMLVSYKDINRKIENMERKYDSKFKIVFEAIKQLLQPAKKPKKKIGF